MPPVTAFVDGSRFVDEWSYNKWSHSCAEVEGTFNKCCQSIDKSLKGTVVNWPIKGLRYCCELINK